MDEEMKIEDYFPEFTKLIRSIRPKYPNVIVYEVDVGLPTDPSLLFRAAEFDENQKITSDPIDVVLSKEWLLEYFSVDTQPETT